ncbi:MAG: (Fe-S)-binding protein [Desulfomonilaceae bacterium]
MNIVQLKKLQYEEVAKCTRCGFCLPNCPTYTVLRSEAFTPRGRNAITRAVIEGRLELSPELAESIFTCLGCGACTKACFPAVNTKDSVFSDRACLTEINAHPKIFEKLSETLNEYHNISEDDNEERADWREYLKDTSEEFFEKDHADVVYFVGCVASFFPMAQKIPADFATIMNHADLDFTILGGEEWCCGFPFIGAGMPEKVEKLKKHNLERLKIIGAKKAVFSCPSCFHTWKRFYDTDVELLHASQLLEGLVKEKKLDLKPLDLKVTYHDPCDLGRNTGVFEEPREVIKSIPGIELVELPNNRNMSVCCGGGGNVEMVAPDLSAAIAQRKIEEILSTGVNTVISSCQQCLRTIVTSARRQNIELKAMDLTQLVMMSLSQK